MTLVRNTNHVVVFNSAYSPELNPIENIFGIWKRKAEKDIRECIHYRISLKRSPNHSLKLKNRLSDQHLKDVEMKYGLKLNKEKICKCLF